MLRIDLQLPGQSTSTAYRLFQSSLVGQSRTASATKTTSSPSDLSRSPFGISTSNRLGPSVRKIQYQRQFSHMASDYPSRLKAVQQIRPHSPSPATGTARSELAKVQLRAFSSRMVTHSVNKTALHPGGVEYVVITAVLDTHGLTSEIQANPRAHGA